MIKNITISSVISFLLFFESGFSGAKNTKIKECQLENEIRKNPDKRWQEIFDDKGILSQILKFKKDNSILLIDKCYLARFNVLTSELYDSGLAEINGNKGHCFINKTNLEIGIERLLKLLKKADYKITSYDIDLISKNEFLFDFFIDLFFAKNEDKILEQRNIEPCFEFLKSFEQNIEKEIGFIKSLRNEKEDQKNQTIEFSGLKFENKENEEIQWIKISYNDRYTEIEIKGDNAKITLFDGKTKKILNEKTENGLCAGKAAELCELKMTSIFFDCLIDRQFKKLENFLDKIENAVKSNNDKNKIDNFSKNNKYHFKFKIETIISSINDNKIISFPKNENIKNNVSSILLLAELSNFSFSYFDNFTNLRKIKLELSANEDLDGLLSQLEKLEKLESVHLIFYKKFLILEKYDSVISNLKKVKNLKEISISRSGNPYESECVKNCSKHFKKLNKLERINILFPVNCAKDEFKNFAKLKNLKYLTLNLLNVISLENMIYISEIKELKEFSVIVNSLPKIDTSDLLKSGKISKDCCDKLDSLFLKFKSIAFKSQKYSNNFGESDMKYICSNFKNLNELSFTEMNGITEKSLKHLSLLKKLETLEFRRMKKIKDNWFCIIKDLKSFQKIRFYKCAEITNQVFNNLKKIKSLSLYDCKKVKESEFIENILELKNLIFLELLGYYLSRNELLDLQKLKKLVVFVSDQDWSHYISEKEAEKLKIIKKNHFNIEDQPRDMLLDKGEDGCTIQ